MSYQGLGLITAVLVREREETRASGSNLIFLLRVL